MKYNTLHKTLASALLLAVCSFANAEIAVIVNSSNPESAITKKDLKKIYLGKSNTFGSTDVKPVDQTENTAVRDDFYSKATDKSPKRARGYWAKMVFSGKAIPPDAIGDDAAVLDWVSKNKDALGYVDSSAVNGSVKTVLTLP